ncbi:hypothetical protein EJ07DRAFT_150410 [Lizonia empirigonia]|nr:hypothetical protein EJ07DRAFT_150410 [Lizonia empirigonia]
MYCEASVGMRLWRHRKACTALHNEAVTLPTLRHTVPTVHVEEYAAVLLRQPAAALRNAAVRTAPGIWTCCRRRVTCPHTCRGRACWDPEQGVCVCVTRRALLCRVVWLSRRLTNIDQHVLVRHCAVCEHPCAAQTICDAAPFIDISRRSGESRARHAQICACTMCVRGPIGPTGGGCFLQQGCVARMPCARMHGDPAGSLVAPSCFRNE